MLSSLEAKASNLPVAGLERCMTRDAYMLPNQLAWLDKQLQPVLAVGRVWLGCNDAEGRLKEARSKPAVQRAPDAGGDGLLVSRMYRLQNGDLYRMPMQDVERERFEYLKQQAK